MFLGHSNQVAPSMERLHVPVLDLGLPAIRSMKNESMLFVSCTLLPQHRTD